MSGFDDELSALFAAAPRPPADDAFARVVAARIHRHERLRALALQAGFGACALAGAVVIEVFGVLARPLLSTAWLKPAVFTAAITAPTQMANGHALLLHMPLMAGVGLATAIIVTAAMSYFRMRR